MSSAIAVRRQARRRQRWPVPGPCPHLWVDEHWARQFRCIRLMCQKTVDYTVKKQMSDLEIISLGLPR